MNNAVVIGGLGIVGQATRKTFGIEDYFDLQGSTLSLEDIARTKKYVFICIPTPTVNGVCQTQGIYDIIRQIEEYKAGHPKIYIIRSTIAPTTTRGLCTRLGIKGIVHNPEFLTESTWEDDAMHPDIVVIGADYPQYAKDIEGMYKAVFKGLDIIVTDSTTAELIKYSINSFYSTKVTFANEIYDYAQKIGANYDTIKNTLYKRKWIGKNHLDVWFGGYRGFGGKCLPKDTQALATVSNSRLLKLVMQLNDENKSKKN